MNQDKIMKEIETFRKKIDKLFPGKTPVMEGEINEMYDCDIYIWRHPGMGCSKHIISGNKISVATATASYLEQLMRQGVFTDKELKEILSMATKAAKGKIK